MARKRCELKDAEGKLMCRNAAERFSGECALCQQRFCGDHRLPEAHVCTKLEDCKQAAFLANKAKLESERTVASKMTAV